MYKQIIVKQSIESFLRRAKVNILYNIQCAEDSLIIQKNERILCLPGFVQWMKTK